MNRLSGKEYQEIKDRAVCVISFENGFRSQSLGGSNYKRAIETIIKEQSRGRVCLLMSEQQMGDMHKLESNFRDRCSLDEAQRIIADDEARRRVWGC